MTVTFCGHSAIYYGEDVENRLCNIVEDMIINGADEFLMGGYGNFDKLAARVIKELKLKYPHISSMLVIPYLHRKYNLELYDGTIYPPLENIPYKFAILKRNQWMVDNSNVLIACVKYSW